MASLSDYLSTPQERDSKVEDLLKQANIYTGNREVLRALGQEDTAKGATPGLLTGLMKTIGVPGNLIRSAILEASGTPTPELARVKGFDEFKKILSGDIQVGFGDVGGLKVKPTDDNVTRALKLGGALVADVATDPISYVGGAGIIGRKAASVRLLESTPTLLPKLRQSPQASSFIDDLVQKSERNRLAKIQKEAGVKEAPMTPAAVMAPEQLERIAAEEVGNYLGQGLQKGGRREVIRRLKEMTGSDAAALEIFKSLPEDVRGGIVITGLLGKPLTKKDGSYVRLTEGTGESLGKFGDVVNRTRLAAATGWNPVTRFASGEAGNVYADMKKALLTGKEGEAGAATLLDYVKVKQGLNINERVLRELKGKVANATAVAAGVASRYGDPGTVERGDFDKIFRDAYFSPKEFDRTTLSPMELEAVSTAQALRKTMTEMYNEGKRAGLDMGEIGTPETYSPMVLDDESYERLSKFMPSVRDYSSTKGRDHLVQFLEEADARGMNVFADPNNPGVYFPDARLANKMEREWGTDRPDFKQFDEDPTSIVGKYGKDLAQRIANRRMLDFMTESGVLFRDIPAVKRLVAGYDQAVALSGLSTIAKDLRERFANEAARIEKELAKLVNVQDLNAAKTAVRAEQVAAENGYKEAKALERQFGDSLAAVNAEIDRLAPRASEIERSLRQYESAVLENAPRLRAAETAARRVRARLAAAEGKAVNDRALINEIVDDFNTTTDPLEKEYLQGILFNNQELVQSVAEVEARIAANSNAKVLAEAELSAARQVRDGLRSTQVKGQQELVQNLYNAIERRNQIIAQMELAREARANAYTRHRRALAYKEYEQVEGIDNLVLGWARTRADYENRKFDLNVEYRNAESTKIPNETRDARAARLAALKAAHNEELSALKAAAKSSKDLFMRTIGATSDKFGAAAKAYADALVVATEKLSDEQLQALLLLKSEQKIREYIETIATNSPDADVTLRAMGDLMTVFKGIRDILPEGTLSKLSDGQYEMLFDGAFTDLRAAMIKDKNVPTAVGEQMLRDGMTETSFSGFTGEIYAKSSIKKMMERIYNAENNPSEFQKLLNDYLDPALLLWKTAVTVGRGPGYVATNLMGGIWMNYLGNVSIKNQKLAGKALQKINENLRKLEKANPERSFLQNLEEAERLTKSEFENIKINGTDLHTIISEFFARGGFFDTETDVALETATRLGSNLEGSALRRTGIRAGDIATDGGKGAEAYRKGVNFALTNRVARLSSNMAQNSELYVRLGAFIDGFQKYGNFESAMSNVQLLHFNYQDLSDAEQWIRRAIPFYTWSRNNIPIQFRAMMLQPGKIQRALYANEEFQNAYGVEGDESWMNQVLPEYINVSNGFASKFTFGDNNIGFFLKLPFEDINRMFQVKGGVPTVRSRELANMLGPFTTPIEIASGVNLQTGSPFNPKGEAVPAYYNLFKFIPGSGVYTDTEGQTRASGALARGIGDLFPQLGTLERFIGGSSAVPALFGGKALDYPDWLLSQKQEDKAFTDLLNVTGLSALTGGSTTTITPSAISGELRRRQDLQRADIERIAASKDYDTDWIREQLRGGKSAEEIAMLLQAGLGKSTQVIPGTDMSSLTATQRLKYRDTLNNL